MADQPTLQIDPRQIREIVSQALDENITRLGRWQAKPLHGGLDPVHRLLRLSGQARTPSGNRPWSLVLKIASGIDAHESDPQDHHFWARESLLYQSGLACDPSLGLSAPRCFQVSQHGDEYWIWLEEVQDELGKPWPVEHFSDVAQCLGRFNGAYLTGRPVPDEYWLSRRWLRKYVESAAPTLHDLEELRRLPYFQRAFSTLSDDFLLEAWGRRHEFISALEKMPQTFCHQDAFTGNLFWQDCAGERGLLVAIDWAYAGTASVGEELAPLVAMTEAFGDLSSFNRLFQVCLDGYLAGLVAAGYPADPQRVAFSSLTAIFYRYLYGALFGEMWPLARHESNHPMLAAVFGLPEPGPLFDLQAAANLVNLNIYQRISRLLPQLV